MQPVTTQIIEYSGFICFKNTAKIDITIPSVITFNNSNT